jgi:hypothetical protein
LAAAGTAEATAPLGAAFFVTVGFADMLAPSSIFMVRRNIAELCTYFKPYVALQQRPVRALVRSASMPPGQHRFDA